MGPQLEGLVNKAEGVQLLVIDIKAWGSPVARQHNINRIPQAWFYEGTERVSTDLRDVLGRLSQ